MKNPKLQNVRPLIILLMLVIIGLFTTLFLVLRPGGAFFPN
jgi:hypothetical protein